MEQQSMLSSKKRSPIPNTTYGKPQYNEIKKGKQRIELSRGCPNNCPYCFEPYAKRKEDSKIFPIPEIKKNNVEILDMNLLWQPNIIKRIKELGSKKVNGKVVYYEEICGIDFRFMTQEIANELKNARFKKIRIAWDWSLKDQIRIKDCIEMFKKAGYKSRDIMVFMIVNHSVPYEHCLRKLDLMKVWGVKVCDCCFDGGYRFAVPKTFTSEQIKDIRKKCRKHNHLVNFGIDPEIKPFSRKNK